MENKMRFSKLTKTSNLNESEVTDRLNFVKRDYNELIKNEKDEAMVYLKTANLVCNGIKLLGTLDPVMLSNEYEINTDKYKKLINDLVKKYL